MSATDWTALVALLLIAWLVTGIAIVVTYYEVRQRYSSRGLHRMGDGRIPWREMRRHVMRMPDGEMVSLGSVFLPVKWWGVVGDLDTPSQMTCTLEMVGSEALSSLMTIDPPVQQLDTSQEVEPSGT